MVADPTDTPTTYYFASRASCPRHRPQAPPGDNRTTLNKEQIPPATLLEPGATQNDPCAVAERYEYDAYGQPRCLNADFTLKATQTSGYGNPIAFTGQRLDLLDTAALPLMYYKNRSYSPTLARFLQRDPLGQCNHIGYTKIGSPRITRQIEPIKQYTDGASLYQFGASNSPASLDPLGTTIVIVPPRGGRSNPFHHQFGPNRCRFASRAAYEKQCSGMFGRRTVPTVSPALLTMVDQAMNQIAKFGYEWYLDQAEDVEDFGKATFSCAKWQIMDAMGQLPCNSNFFHAALTAGGITKEDGTTTPVRVVQIYQVSIVSRNGSCYLTSSHFTLKRFWTYKPWEKHLTVQEDLEVGDCPLNTRGPCCCCR